MAMGIWRGVGGVARKVKKQYRGVNGVARQIKKEWRGVGGVARLTLTSGEILYENGNNVAGFRASNTSGTVTLNSDHIAFTGVRNNVVSTSNTYDLSKYSKLCVEYEIEDNPGNRAYAGIRFGYTSDGETMTNGSSYLPITLDKVMVAEIDISGKTRTCDVIIRVVCSDTTSGVSTNNLSGRINKIWFE